jgi:hypothetical protein
MARSTAQVREELRALSTVLRLLRLELERNAQSNDLMWRMEQAVKPLERLRHRLHHAHRSPNKLADLIVTPTAPPIRPAPPVPVTPLSPSQRREPVDPGIAVFAAMARGHTRTTK